MTKFLFVTIFMVYSASHNAFGQLNYALLDETFGTLGRASINQGVASTGSSDNQGRRTMHVVEGGKIILVGTGKASGTDYDIFVGKMNANGSADESFGSGGSVFVHCGGTADIAWGSTIAPDQSIVIAGTYIDPFGGGSNQILVVWLNANGTLRGEFDGDGIWTMNISNSSSSEGHDVKVNEDGKLYVAFHTNVGNGNAGREFGLMRLNEDGTFDGTFGTDGKVFVIDPNTQDLPYRLALQPDGKIIIGGTKGGSPMRYQFARFTTTGVLDPDFGSGGIATFPHLNDLNIPNFFSLAVEAGGKIVAGANAAAGSSSNASVVRLNSNGTLDNGFGQGGIAQLGTPTTARAVLRNADGDYYVVGAGNSQVSVSKISSTGNLISGFGANGTANLGNTIPNSVDLTGAILANGKFLVAGRVTEPGLQKYGVLRTGGVSNATEERIKDKMIIYPNPANTWIRIEPTDQELKAYRILSLDGRVHQQGLLSGNLVLDVSELAKGMYVIQVDQDTQRIVIE